jgi:hypothetical protein
MNKENVLKVLREKFNVPEEILSKLELGKWGELTFEDRPFAFCENDDFNGIIVRFTGEFRQYALKA